MKTIFKTGTYLTAENLNLAQLAYGSAGVISGAEVYSNGNNLIVSSGLLKFSDGMIVSLDGTDYFDWSNLAHNKYYCFAVRYGNDVTFSVSLVLPTDYEYIILAVATIGDSCTIVNVQKSSISKSEKIIDGIQLSPTSIIYDGLGTAELVTDSDKYVKYLSGIISAGSTSAKIYVPFTNPLFTITKAKLKLKLSSDTILGIYVYVDGKKMIPENNKIYGNTFTKDNYTVDFGSIFSSIESGTSCSILLWLSQISSSEENTTSDISLYSITLTNS